MNISNPSSSESLATLSVEENKELFRSTKKVKANSSEFPSAPRKVITYKDTFVGSKFKNYESFFLDNNDTMEEEDMVDHPPNPDQILDLKRLSFIYSRTGLSPLHNGRLFIARFGTPSRQLGRLTSG
ncbi:hypothetical protein GOBAR_DD10565 [Gossypium barbadense]|nr:hypothetical protein GOBAR_DD10565 [Gossypium barbadense]